MHPMSMGLWAGIVLAAGIWVATAGNDVRTIVQQSVAANDRDWAALPQFNHYERDGIGKRSRTYQVLMIAGSPYKQLVERGGKPISPAEQAAEKSKLERAIAERRAESPEARAARIGEYHEQRRQEHVMIQQLSAAFYFRMAGQGRLAGREVYVLEATPKPGYRPPNRDSKVLTGMHGKLWIDAHTFQWVRVEAEVIHPVSMAGFLARVEPGTRFELEYAPVADGIWEPVHYAMQLRARVLLMFGRRGREEESYFKYQKAG
jgi:hypothetical protein